MRFITRSLLILLALYGLVFAIGDAYLAHAGAPLWVALLFAVVFIGLQYLAAPWIIGRLMHIHWDRELPPANGEFVERLCAQRGLKIPRMGIIESGTPNAFSFGEDGGTHRAYSRWVQYAGAAAAVGIGWLWLSAIRG